MSLIVSPNILDLLFKMLSDLTTCWCFSLLQKIENLKETTCVSQNLAHFPSCRLEGSDDFLVAEFFCLLVSEHGRVHQALYCTAADRKGNLNTGFVSTLCCATSVIIVFVIIQRVRVSEGRFPCCQGWMVLWV